MYISGLRSSSVRCTVMCTVFRQYCKNTNIHIILLIFSFLHNMSIDNTERLRLQFMNYIHSDVPDYCSPAWSAPWCAPPGPPCRACACPPQSPWTGAAGADAPREPQTSRILRISEMDKIHLLVGYIPLDLNQMDLRAKGC